MLKEELMSIHAALGIVENLSEGEEMKRHVGLCRHNCLLYTSPSPRDTR